MIEEVRHLLSQESNERGIPITFDYTGVNKSIAMNVDKLRIKQVLINIIL